ncbi:hypothetical protein IFHNHDMJ_02140 [Synechococcus sp. CBW1107]|nr:hypothetical protein IFHNHDMJ_02140 [Synechococcus sp. CBW1107]
MEPHGSALSAIDVLRSIPQAYQKYILTEYPIAKGNHLHGSVPLSFYPPALIFWPHPVAKRISGAFARLYSSIFFFWLRNFKFDLVIVNGYGTSSLWLKASKSIPASTASAVISRESPRHFDSGDCNHSLADQIQFLRSFDAHIFVSRILRDEWIALAALDVRRTHYLPNCCDEDKLLFIDRNCNSDSLIRSNYGIHADIPLILNVGTIELRKGQQDLECLAHHLRKRDLDFRIACVGYEATEQGSLFRQRIQSSLLYDFFIFPGATDQIYFWYQASTMLAFTSRAEAMPRTILEAMASDLPIVSTNVDGIPELIDHLKDGYLYCPGDTDELILGVEWIIDNPGKARNLGANARRKYLELFSQRLHALRMRKILNDVIIE